MNSLLTIPREVFETESTNKLQQDNKIDTSPLLTASIDKCGFTMVNNPHYWNNPPSYLLKYIKKNTLNVHVTAMNEHIANLEKYAVPAFLSYAHFERSANNIWHLHFRTYKIIDPANVRLYKENFSKAMSFNAARTLIERMYADGLVQTNELSHNIKIEL